MRTHRCDTMMVPNVRLFVAVDFKEIEGPAEIRILRGLPVHRQYILGKSTRHQVVEYDYIPIPSGL